MTPRIRTLALACVCLTLPAAARAQTVPPLTYERYALPNGLDVILDGLALRLPG